ncbi:MAG: acyl carrier protein [Lachnospiraceae bacterium]|nr:acyl carrier protein [Lachnospiraceae bacterium]
MLEKVREMMAEQWNIDVEEITPTTNLQDDLGIDSLDLFEFVMAIEEEFGIEVPTEKASEMHTLQEVVNYLEEATK